MKTKLLLLIVTLFSFAVSCEPNETQKETILPIQQDCECRKMYYEQQTINYGIRFVFTHRDNWSFVDCNIKQNGILESDGFIRTGFYSIDATHNYRWECKNE